jgi:PHD/YefM family antitoxin component YafN of YafNO toxin-antitoxin module
MIELTQQQRRELEMTGWPPLVVNTATQQTFVLLPVELFERVQAMLDAQDAESPAGRETLNAETMNDNGQPK